MNGKKKVLVTPRTKEIVGLYNQVYTLLYADALRLSRGNFQDGEDFRHFQGEAPVLPTYPIAPLPKPLTINTFSVLQKGNILLI